MKIRLKKSNEEITVLKRKPKGWSEIKGASTQPVGSTWIKNGPFFMHTKNGKLKKNPNYKQKLLITDEKLFRERLKEKSSSYEIVESKKPTQCKNIKQNKKSKKRGK